jgi:hypothetical protein
MRQMGGRIYMVKQTILTWPSTCNLITHDQLDQWCDHVKQMGLNSDRFVIRDDEFPRLVVLEAGMDRGKVDKQSPQHLDLVHPGSQTHLGSAA